MSRGALLVGRRVRIKGFRHPSAPDQTISVWTADAAATPLSAALIAEGRARLDPLKLGLDLDEAGRVLHADGAVDPDLYVLGPPARATLWETIAVPDIRQRIEALTDRLTA